MVPYKITDGIWSDDVAWEFHRADVLPPEHLCTAVFCLALLHDDQIVLTRTKRGWEMLGGHIEPGETIVDALFRETHEEGGYTPQQYELYGYRKIISKRPMPARDGRYYPHPISYIPHFVAKSNVPLDDVHGDEGEIIESAAFAMRDINTIELDNVTRLLINEGLKLNDRLFT